MTVNEANTSRGNLDASPRPAPEKCPHCDGRGSVRFGRGLLRTTEGCPDCAGTGRVLSREEQGYLDSYWDDPLRGL